MNPIETLFIISAAAGVVLLLGMLILLSKRVVYLDRETQQPTEFELPVLGKLRTQSPVIVIIFVGAFLVTYPVYLKDHQGRDLATVEGNIVAKGKTVTVTVVPVPRYQEVVDDQGPFKLHIPREAGVSYRAKFIVDKVIQGDQAFDLAASGTRLKDFIYTPEPSAPTTAPAIRREISDETLQRLGINP